MEVNISSETKDCSVYETEKFCFKISEEKLNKMKDKPKFEDKIRTKVMKQMKVVVTPVTGQEWQESYEAIVDKLLN